MNIPWNRQLPERKTKVTYLPKRVSLLFSGMFRRIENALREQLDLSAKLSLCESECDECSATVFTFRVYDGQARLLLPDSLCEELFVKVEQKLSSMQRSSTVLEYVLLDVISVVDSRELKRLYLTGVTKCTSEGGLAIDCCLSGKKFRCYLQLSEVLNRRISWHARRRLGNSPLKNINYSCQLSVPITVPSVMAVLDYNVGTRISLGSEARLNAGRAEVPVQMKASEGAIRLSGVEARLREQL